MGTTQAQAFAVLREAWLQLKGTIYADSLPFMFCTPTYVPNPKTDGDGSTVYFADGSSLYWDWDNGDFLHEYNSSERLTYPWDADDILFTLRGDTSKSAQAPAHDTSESA
jgi:hypothetical protein